MRHIFEDVLNDKRIKGITFVLCLFTYSALAAANAEWNGFYSVVSISENAGEDKVFLNDVFFVIKYLNIIDRNKSFSGLFQVYLLQKDRLVCGAEI